MSTKQQAPIESPWTLGWRIRWAMENHNLSREQLAEETGFAPSSISRWTHGLAEPRKQIIQNIADLCEVDYTWLATGEGHPTRPDPAPGPRGPQGPRGPGRLTRRSLTRTSPLSIDLRNRAAA